MINTKLENLNLLDKFLFDEAMEDRETYQATVGILLEKELNILGTPETEKEFRVSPGLRQVRLDVVGMDSERRLYFAEMQQRNTGNLIRRSRYYQAQLDVSLLEPGSRDFNLLNESCFILIAPFDLFGKGLYRYTFEGTCRECPDLKLEDGAGPGIYRKRLIFLRRDNDLFFPHNNSQEMRTSCSIVGSKHFTILWRKDNASKSCHR